MKRPISEVIAWNTSLRRKNPGTETWVKPFVKQFGERLREKTPIDGKRLGCGAYGCAYAGREGWTVKVTSDRMEGALSQFVLNVREKHGYAALPGIVQIASVLQGPAVKPDWSTRPKTVYVITREDVTPISTEELRLADAAEDRNRSAHDLVSAVNHLMDAYEAAQGALDSSTPETHLRAFAAAVRRLRAHWPVVAKTLEVMFVKHGILLADVHWGNIGWTINGVPGVRAHGDAVIFDIGATKATFPSAYAPRAFARL